MAGPRFLLAIPVFNEQQYVRGVLQRVMAHVPDVLVVDDGSTDDTPSILAEHAGLHVLRHPTNLGYGRSLTDAFGFAIRAGYDWLITMDCDDQHEPAHIPQFIEAARLDDADLISGSRYLPDLRAPVPGADVGPDGHGAAPPDRRRINVRITRRLNRVLGLEITDAFCGFKAYRTARLRDLRITEPGYAMPLQVWVQAARSGWRIRELAVPLIYVDLQRGFGRGLDDPEARYRYYVGVLEEELRRSLPCVRDEERSAPADATACCSLRAAC